MTLLVDPYQIRESNRSKIKMCHECTYIPVWEVREFLVDSPVLAYACGVHIDTVLYLVSARIANNTGLEDESES